MKKHDKPRPPGFREVASDITEALQAVGCCVTLYESGQWKQAHDEAASQHWNSQQEAAQKARRWSFDMKCAMACGSKAKELTARDMRIKQAMETHEGPYTSEAKGAERMKIRRILPALKQKSVDFRAQAGDPPEFADPFRSLEIPYHSNAVKTLDRARKRVSLFSAARDPQISEIESLIHKALDELSRMSGYLASSELYMIEIYRPDYIRSARQWLDRYHAELSEAARILIRLQETVGEVAPYVLGLGKNDPLAIGILRALNEPRDGYDYSDFSISQITSIVHKGQKSVQRVLLVLCHKGLVSAPPGNRAGTRYTLTALGKRLLK